MLGCLGKILMLGGKFGMLGRFSLSNPVCLLCYNLGQDYDYLTLCESEQQHYLGWNTKETLCRFSSIGFDSKIMYCAKCLFPPRSKIGFSFIFTALGVNDYADNISMKVSQLYYIFPHLIFVIFPTPKNTKVATLIL